MPGTGFVAGLPAPGIRKQRPALEKLLESTLAQRGKPLQVAVAHLVDRDHQNQARRGGENRESKAEDHQNPCAELHERRVASCLGWTGYLSSLSFKIGAGTTVGDAPRNTSLAKKNLPSLGTIMIWTLSD